MKYWCILKIKNPKETIYKLFRYGLRDWSINSGITRIEKLDEQHYKIYGVSGSIYTVDKNHYLINNSSLLNKLKEQVKKLNSYITELDFDEEKILNLKFIDENN